MAKRYRFLTSPLAVRNKILKTRLIHPVAQPHFMQANETYPAESTVSYYETRAKNGAAMIWLQDCTDMTQRSMPSDVGHFNMYNLDDKGAQNGLTAFAENMHLYGTLVCPELNLGRRMNLSCNDPAWHVELPRSLPAANTDPRVILDKNGNRIPLYTEDKGDLTTGFNEGSKYEKGSKPAMGGGLRYMTRELMDEYIEATIIHAKQYQRLNFDGGFLDLSHNFPIGQFLRPCVNHRTDEYGGSFENRIRFPLEVIRRLREAMGEDFILSINSPVLNGDSCGDGMTLDELAEFLRRAEPYVDILQLRRRNPDHTNSDYCEAAEYSAYLKAQGVKMPIAINTYYKDLDKIEAILAEGKADLIAPGHLFICNEHLGDILKNGNGEDLNPCIECHICRGSSGIQDWQCHCTINPELGFEGRLDKIIQPARKPKRVAIIGGGPGGMKCAMYLKDRGHTPVIYEKADALGGQIRMSEYADFKWELLRYLNYLRAQVEKRNIEVHLNTEATPDMIREAGYDVVISALGGQPKAPNISGVENARWNPVNIYGNEDQIGKNVVVIGGASSATEAAVYLSKQGHNVTQLSRKNCLGYDLNPIRMVPYMNVLANLNNVTPYYKTKTLEIGKNYVTFLNQQGERCTLSCDDVVASGGIAPLQQEAMAFHDCADEFYLLGDCRSPGTMRHAIRDAFGIAMQI